MDNKQLLIFHKICDKYKLPHKNKFKQFRNLKEFRYFMIERINPNHRILLYGKLKKSYDVNKNPNRIIKVGEILLSYSLCLIDTHNPLFKLMLLFSGFYLQTFIFYTYFFKINFGEFVINYVNRYRGEYREWKNSICC